MSWGFETVIENVKKGNVPYFMVFIMVITMALSITVAIYTGSIHSKVINTKGELIAIKDSNPRQTDPIAQKIYNMCTIIIAFSSIIALSMLIQRFQIFRFLYDYSTLQRCNVFYIARLSI
jgi:hypothetical protein